MDQLTQALVTFVIIYAVSLLTRSVVGKEREGKPFSTSLKDKGNHATAAIIALTTAVVSAFLK